MPLLLKKRSAVVHVLPRHRDEFVRKDRHRDPEPGIGSARVTETPLIAKAYLILYRQREEPFSEIRYFCMCGHSIHDRADPLVDLILGQGKFRTAACAHGITV